MVLLKILKKTNFFFYILVKFFENIDVRKISNDGEWNQNFLKMNWQAEMN